MSSEESLHLVFNVNAIAFIAINAIAFFALLLGAKRRGRAATALGLLGVAMSLPQAVYSAALQFDWYQPEDSDATLWPLAILGLVSIVGAAFVLLALIIAKSPTPRTQYQPPAPPQPYQGYSQPNRY